MLPKGKGVLLAVTPDEDEPASEEMDAEESDEGELTEDQIDAAATLREALAGDDDAALVAAFKAMKMACAEEY